MAESKSPLINTATTLGKVVAFFVASALAGVLVAGTLVPLAIGASKVTDVASGAYDSIQIPKTNAAIAQPSYLLDRNGKVLAKFFTQNRKEVKLKNVSPWMRKAIVSIEDERFYEHGGVDARGITRALVNNVSGAGTQGASTITQQYVANLNVNNQAAAGVDESQIARNGNKDLSDKVVEIKWANEIEKTMSKDQILEGYLNLVPFAGATYGVEAASQRWFSKPSKDLNIQESALLAGMVQRPTRFNPTVNPKDSLKRRNVVLASMLKTGAITQKQYDAAVKTKIQIKPSEEESGCAQAGSAAYFCQYVFDQISNDPAFGKTRQARQALVLTGGLRITTTLDSRLQSVAAKEVQKTVPATDTGGAGASLVSRNNKTGEILAMAQNTLYGDKGQSAKYKYQYTQRNFATSNYQGGSTAKPWTAIAWLEAGHKMSETVDARKKSYDGDWKASCLPGGSVNPGHWEFGNADKTTNVPMTASAGLYWSINTATVAEARKLDLCKIFDVPQRLGLLDGQKTDAGNGKYVTASPEALAQAPSNVIGAQTVTPLAQSRAFGAFANNGQLCTTVSLLKVTRPNGKSIDVPKTSCQQEVDPDVLSQMNQTLKQIAGTRVAKGTIDADIGGKTGTNNYATSTWFAGYSSDITTISWVGRQDGFQYNKDTKSHPGLNSGILVKGSTHYGADSSTFAAPQWLNYMSQVIHDYPTNEIPSSGYFSKAFAPGPGGLSGTGGTAKKSDNSTPTTKATESSQAPATSRAPTSTDTPTSTGKAASTGKATATVKSDGAQKDTSSKGAQQNKGGGKSTGPDKKN